MKLIFNVLLLIFIGYAGTKNEVKVNQTANSSRSQNSIKKTIDNQIKKMAKMYESWLVKELSLTGYVKASLKRKPANIQIGFEPPDVKAALKQALQLGATLITNYEIKPWGWESAIVRDIEGNIVELAKKCE